MLLHDILDVATYETNVATDKSSVATYATSCDSHVTTFESYVSTCNHMWQHILLNNDYVGVCF